MGFSGSVLAINESFEDELSEARRTLTSILHAVEKIDTFQDIFEEKDGRVSTFRIKASYSR